MRPTQKVLRIVMVGLLLIGVNEPSFAGTDKEFGEVKDDFSQAIESRNFKNAKVLLGELFPLMKADIKQSKKNLVHLKKEDSPERDLARMEEDLKRKTELFDAIKHLVDASPAAIRVKSVDLVAMVQEFDELRLTE